jgi:hypothetical protein
MDLLFIVGFEKYSDSPIPLGHSVALMGIESLATAHLPFPPFFLFFIYSFAVACFFVKKPQNLVNSTAHVLIPPLGSLLSDGGDGTIQSQRSISRCIRWFLKNPQISTVWTCGDT